MSKQLGTMAWPSQCVRLSNSHSPVLAGTQQAHRSILCPHRRSATAPFLAAACSPTAAPCVALSTSPPLTYSAIGQLCLHVSLSAGQPCCGSCSLGYSVVTPCTLVLSCQPPPRNSCSAMDLLLPHVPCVPQMLVLMLLSTQLHGLHICHVQFNNLCMCVPPPPAHLQCFTVAPPGLTIRLLVLAHPLCANRQCLTAHSQARRKLGIVMLHVVPFSTAMVYHQAVLTRSRRNPVTTAHATIHQSFLHIHALPSNLLSHPELTRVVQQLLRVALVSFPLLHTDLHSTICTVTGPELCCVSG